MITWPGPGCGLGSSVTDGLAPYSLTVIARIVASSLFWPHGQDAGTNQPLWRPVVAVWCGGARRGNTPRGLDNSSRCRRAMPTEHDHHRGRQRELPMEDLVTRAIDQSARSSGLI